jgi:hypothetical protein
MSLAATNVATFLITRDPQSTKSSVSILEKINTTHGSWKKEKEMFFGSAA